MSIDEALAATLAAAVPSVIGRVYAVRLPQLETLPALTYQRISTARDYHQEGPDGLPSARFQVDVWAGTFAECRVAANQVRLALSGRRGALGSVGIGYCFLEGEQDSYDSETRLYRTTLEFALQYEEVL